MLNEQKEKMIDLLIEGTTSKVDIAKILGVSRETLYRWMGESEVITERDRRITLMKNEAEKNIASKSQLLIDEMTKIALTSKSEPERIKCLKYLLNRIYGNPKNSVDVDAVVKDDTDIDILSVIDEIENEN